MHFDRDKFFTTLRGGAMFGSSFDQQQVDGLETLLKGWETKPTSEDLRHFAYMLATTFHETSATMQPIEEYGKGEGQSYGKKDPETGQTYYGRGFVQLTWRDNYKKATAKLGLTGNDDLEWHAARALDPDIAYQTMSRGMTEGWFRSSDGKPETCARYFNATVNDAYGAREIINGDKTKIPSWSNGKSIGNLIAGYHSEYLKALEKSLMEEEMAPPAPPTEPAQPEFVTITLKLTLPRGSKIEIT